ncbi:hypothetical protein, partial [Endozoicomonas sp. ONNA2]|uniref:hypothetical protein n=1 Tax=Endozoicomonas sp. ONNA2 TaxID=2828741 RepID=UPI0021483895
PDITIVHSFFSFCERVQAGWFSGVAGLELEPQSTRRAQRRAFSFPLCSSCTLWFKAFYPQFSASLATATPSRALFSDSLPQRQRTSEIGSKFIKYPGQELSRNNFHISVTRFPNNWKHLCFCGKQSATFSQTVK